MFHVFFEEQAHENQFSVMYFCLLYISLMLIRDILPIKTLTKYSKKYLISLAEPLDLLMVLNLAFISNPESVMK